MTARQAAKIEDTEPPEAAATGEAGRVVIATRFGEFAFDRAQAILMPRGLLGFPGQRVFALTPLPQPGLAKFSLLQCLDQPDLSFLVVPLDVNAGIIDRGDIDRARDDLGIAEESLAAVLIVTVRELDGRPQLSVNLRAPVFFDSDKRIGFQHVLSSSKYPVRHVLSDADDGGRRG